MILFFGFIFGMFITLTVLACYVLVFAFTVWMAIDAGKQDRFWWLTLIIGIPIVGPSVYYMTEKKHEYALAPVHHIHTTETEEQHEKAPKKRVARKPKIKEAVAQPAQPVQSEILEEEKTESILEAIEQTENKRDEKSDGNQ